MTPFSLANVFRDLANDPSWPKGMCWEHKLDKARLALMVVEKSRCNPSFIDSHDPIRNVLFTQSINPSDYANVKKRIADTEKP